MIKVFILSVYYCAGEKLTYRLTQAVSVHGCSCKLPQHQLVELLAQAGLSSNLGTEVLAGLGENSSVIQIAPDLAILNTLDFFTPMVNEPELQGRIAASNVTSDIYTLAVSKIVSILVIMAYPEDMPMELASGMLRGFNDFCCEIGAPVIGGHTVQNPWPLIGGGATGIGDPKQLIYTKGAKPGDRLFLTKPLGIAPAMAAYRLCKDNVGRDFLKNISSEFVEEIVNQAIANMITPNKSVAEVMQKISVHAATDITGFGLKGHAMNMARLSGVDIVIDKLWVIQGTPILSEVFGYPLLSGESKETAGGILIAVAKENADDLQSELFRYGVKHMEVGYVMSGNGNVRVLKSVKVIET
ncbi:MAG: selenide, water dikinase SelD [Nitrososphaerota archaeon]|jgi:selenide,water dikinase|nr:selenide, water dikinase SelD [Nitrososphaerota archaeon]